MLTLARNYAAQARTASGINVVVWKPLRMVGSAPDFGVSCRVHVRCEVVVKHRQDQARKNGARLSQKIVSQSVTSVMKAMMRISAPLCGQRNRKISSSVFQRLTQLHQIRSTL
jgi:hypothetical protein